MFGVGNEAQGERDQLHYQDVLRALLQLVRAYIVVRPEVISGAKDVADDVLHPHGVGAPRTAG